MRAPALARICTRRLAGAVRAWAIALLLAVGSMVGMGHLTSVVGGPVAATAQGEATESAAPTAAVCAVDLDSDKDTADREFTSPPAIWLALGAGASDLGAARLMAPQFAAPPPQRPPRLAA